MLSLLLPTFPSTSPHHLSSFICGDSSHTDVPSCTLALCFSPRSLLPRGWDSASCKTVHGHCHVKGSHTSCPQGVGGGSLVENQGQGLCPTSTGHSNLDRVPTATDPLLNLCLEHLCPPARTALMLQITPYPLSLQMSPVSSHTSAETLPVCFLQQRQRRQLPLYYETQCSLLCASPLLSHRTSTSHTSGHPM